MPIDHETAAAALYAPTPTSDGQTATTPPTQAQAPKVRRLDPIQRAQRDVAQTEQRAQALYDDPADAKDVDGYDKTHASTQRVIIEAGVQRLGLEPDAAHESATEWAQTFNRYGLASSESNDLTEIAVGVMSGAVEPDRQAWANDARSTLTSEYGESAEAILEASRKLVAQDKPLFAYLDRTGLGSHPRIVSLIARKAHALRKAGKL